MESKFCYLIIGISTLQNYFWNVYIFIREISKRSRVTFEINIKKKRMAPVPILKVYR